jgi:hypothetical protein
MVRVRSVAYISNRATAVMVTLLHDLRHSMPGCGRAEEYASRSVGGTAPSHCHMRSKSARHNCSTPNQGAVAFLCSCMLPALLSCVAVVATTYLNFGLVRYNRQTTLCAIPTQRVNKDLSLSRLEPRKPRTPRTPSRWLYQIGVVTQSG